MKTLTFVTHMVFVASAMAQTQGVVIEQAPVQVVQAGPQAQIQSETIVLPGAQPTAPLAHAQPMVQAQPLGQPVYEQQPTTVIQASPLTQSRAEQLRQAREHAEIQTEQMIVEKLEQSRLEDERRRAQQLFGGALDVTQPVPPAAPVQPAAPQAQAPAAAPGASIEDVRAAVREELAEVNKVDESQSEQKNYVLGTFGITDYSFDNVENVGSLAVAFGKQFDPKWSVEFGIHYSELFIDESYWAFRDMSQYGLNVTSRFNFLTGRILPNLGLGVQYTRREYSAPRDSINGMPFPSYIGELTSDAIDLGIVAGVDFNIADRFSMGLEYRYLMNITYRYSEDEQNTAIFRQGSALEDTDYDLWGVTLKYLF